MQHADEYLDDGRDRVGWSHRTVASYRSHLHSLLAWLTGRLGRIPTPQDVTDIAIQTHDTMLKRAGKAQRSRSSMQACYVSFARWLYERGEIDADQFAAVERMARVRVTEKPKRRFATPAHVALMFEACALVGDKHTSRCRYRQDLAPALLSVLAYTGARCNEVCALRLADVDLSSATPSITFRHAKGDKSRTTPLHNIVVKYLRVWIGSRPVDHPALFAAPVYRLGQSVQARPMTSAKVEGVLRELQKLAGIEDEAVTKPHAYRRFAATNLLKVPGATIRHVQEFLGHSDPMVSLKYIGTAPGELEGLINSMQIKRAPEPVKIRRQSHRQDMRRIRPRR